MIGIEALECFLDNWHSKIKEYENYDEFEAMVEYAFGSDVRVVNTRVIVEKFFEKKIRFEDLLFEDLKTCFLPEEVEFDEENGNLYINRNLYKIKIAPRIY
ncbi:hypothetical protein [Caminibacter mediatlanticus]|uniref:Uncharacterized protein n=1 Tax=Caminibacter mediatlanticus TB-2 TaxID=391592 RepID=A0AAI9AI50_9BACT|nr:hypothetical protein [Caminibacter mediatlanticus]EDM24025.1 hypothetical protein CMTB2_07216 [Caminibacter mediatlanticus TB-2]